MSSFAADPRCITLLSALALPGCSAAVADPTPAEPRYELTATARLDAASEARFLAAERDAVIVRVLVGQGDKVVAGQPLLELACADVRARAAAAAARAGEAAADARLVAAGPRKEIIAAAAARVDESRSKLHDAADLLARAELLKTNGFVSTRRLNQLTNDRDSQAAALAKASAELAALANGARPDERVAAAEVAVATDADARAIGAETEKCILRAPIDGTVLRVLKHAGEFSGASMGTPVMVVANLEHMIAKAEVTDRDAWSVRQGMAADIWVDGSAQRWRGHVVTLSGQMGRKTARSLDPSDRFDRDTREAWIAFDGEPPPAVVGLRVYVGLRG
jgi:multidrug resistance efflux pump